MSKHICNKTSTTVALLGGVVMLSPEGSKGDSVFLPEFSLGHVDIREAVSRKWVVLLTPQEFRSAQAPSAAPVVVPATPVEAAAPVSVPEKETDEDGESAAGAADDTADTEENPALPALKLPEVFASLTKKRKAAYLEKLELHNEVDRRSESKMVEFYAAHYALHVEGK